MALRFTENQLKISQSLLAGPLSLEQVAQKTGIPPMGVQEELKNLIQWKIASLQGTPPVYALKPEIIEELKRRKGMEQDDDNKFRIKILIEVQAVEEELVQKQLDRILQNLQKEPFYRIYSIHTEPVAKIEEKYSTFTEVNLSVRDFRALVRLMFFYGPASVEVIKPSKIEFTLSDLQDGLVDMTEMVHAYADYIMGLLNRKQVEEFNARFYAGARQAKAVQDNTEKNPPSPSVP